MSTVLIWALVIGFLALSAVTGVILHLITLYHSPTAPKPADIVVGALAFLLLGLPILLGKAFLALVSELTSLLRRRPSSTP